MKYLKIFIALLTIQTAVSFTTATAQTNITWTEEKLLDPEKLASSINSKKDVPLILCIGPGASIPGSVDIGMVNNKAGLEKFKKQLASTDKNKKLVIYCGCCPFEHCPNVRPAMEMLKDLNFTNYFLLYIPHNLKKDWIDKGYPVKG